MTHDRRPAAAHRPVLSRRRRLVIGVLTAVRIANAGVPAHHRPPHPDPGHPCPP
jgi:hypothetical protein